ncbi:MAG: xanthine dehydrogenase family protein subunit M [Candidatus Acidiferrales bacterium]
MYPHPFRYYRPSTLEEASAILSELGEDAKALAGGQSLIPLMKLRLSAPSSLVDLNFIPGISYVKRQNGTLHFGAMARHADIERSEAASRVPILHDCAAGIADSQVRNRGTIGGSIAEADPSGDWGAVLLTLETKVHVIGPNGPRTIPLPEFFLDAYTTALKPGELVQEITVKMPAKDSGGAYVAFKRCAPVYATASAAVTLTLGEGDTCKDARIALGCVGLMTIQPAKAEAALRGQKLTPKVIEAAADAARAATDPQGDMRGSADYKRTLARALVKRAIHLAARRARGENVEASHEYVGRI